MVPITPIERLLLCLAAILAPGVTTSKTGKVASRSKSGKATAEALLQAIIMALMSCWARKRRPATANLRISSGVRSP